MRYLPGGSWGNGGATFRGDYFHQVADVQGNTCAYTHILSEPHCDKCSVLHAINQEKLMQREDMRALERTEAEPLVMRRKLRNPSVPAAWCVTCEDAVMNPELTDLRRQYRKPFDEARMERNKKTFVDEARSDPAALYDGMLAVTNGLDLNAIIGEISERRRRHLLTIMGGDLGGIVFNPPPAGQGEMWWGETSFHLPNRIGMNAFFNDAGLLLFGGLNWDGANLLQASLRVVSSFFMEPARMPMANRVRSNPGGVLVGHMVGSTGGGKPFFFGGFAEGDYWSKCDLRLAQRAFAMHPDNPNDIIPAAPVAVASFKVIDLDDTADFAEAPLPGGLAYPAVDLLLIKERILRIDLELDLFIQLEGDGDIRFGGIGDSNPALHQWVQWKLQPL